MREEPVTTEVEAIEDQAPSTSEDALLDDELLVEDVSIDGMCGVY